MRTKAMQISGLLIVAMGQAVGPSLAHDDEPAPSKAPVEVTYYYLPG